jgi:hypothetical protein
VSASSQVWEAWSRYLGHAGPVRRGFYDHDFIIQQQTPTLITVEVRVPFTVLAYEAEFILDRNYRDMTVRGFRPGKAPRYLVLPHIRRWLLLESLSQLLLPTWSTKAAALPGQLVETSELQLDVSFEGGEECLVVSCESEVLPQAELQPLSSTPPLTLDASNTESNQPREDFDSLCRSTDVTAPPSLVNLLTVALTRITQEQLNPELLRTAVQDKLHKAQIARAVLGQYTGEEEEIQLAGEVEHRAAILGISAATFRARYLATEEQRELFSAHVRQDRALRRLSRARYQQDSI